MSDPLSSSESEVVNLDNCSSKNALLVGALVAFVLSFVPILNAMCCIHLAIAGLITVFVYTNKHKIAIEVWQGIKLAVLAVFIGSALATLVYDLGIAMTHDFDAGMLKEMIISQIESSGRGNTEQAVEFVEKVVPDELSAVHVVVIVCFQLIAAALASFVGGAIGGSIGAASFKKGPLAK